MIKFFRHIRKSLIDKNQMGKYFKYAIGEILLVVIGILIALQINNWNEQRKNKTLLKKYTENLIEDLEIDRISLQEDIAKIEIDKQELDLIRKRISNSNHVLDTILKIARYDFTFYIPGKDIYKNDTYGVLNATGHISLFNNDIIDKLNKLNNLQDLALIRNKHTLESYLANLRQYAQKYPVPFEYNLFDNNNENTDVIWKDVSLRNHATEFNALVISKGDSHRLSGIYLPQLLKSTNELLTELRKYN